ncbi:MAG: type 1 glutamine amidotransferase [Methanomicrobiales archaeon]|nr:type 1 glutamine amidotransferase [Methanomicrobiales archaeon]
MLENIYYHGSCLPYPMIAVFQHGVDETAGEVGNYLRTCRIPYTLFPLFESGYFPTELPQHLIVLGGEMSVNDTWKYPFLLKELEIIRAMIAKNRPILGICLGAQLIASAGGQRVFRDTREEGWITIHGSDSRYRHVFPKRFTVFHWHDETFTLPLGAELLGKGSVIPNQAFRYGSAIGVQYHPEVTLQIISRWTEGHDASQRKKILAQSEQYISMNRQHCHTLVDHFIRGGLL